MAAVKLESENSEYARARRLLAKARASASTARVWMKSARLEWCLGELNDGLAMLEEATKLYRQAPKLWLMLGQLLDELSSQKGLTTEEARALKERARAAYRDGVRNFVFTLFYGSYFHCYIVERYGCYGQTIHSWSVTFASLSFLLGIELNPTKVMWFWFRTKISKIVGLEVRQDVHNKCFITYQKGQDVCSRIDLSDDSHYCVLFSDARSHLLQL